MSRLIGYYVHHQGDGHRQRALAIAHAAPDRFVLIGTGLAERADGLQCLELPDDRPRANTAFAAFNRCLHYVPYGLDGVRQRVAAVAGWIALHRPALMVVDVSVEIAMLAHLAATPTVYVRLAGLRNDAAHLGAFAAARLLISPFASVLDSPRTEAWVRDKTCFLPGITRAVPCGPRHPGTVLVVNGLGGDALDGYQLAMAAAATPALSWRVIGPVLSPASQPANLHLLGWVHDADREIATAGIVIGSAGDGLVNAVIATGARFICIPQARDYEEQAEKARRLDALDAAIVIDAWPAATEWPSLLKRAALLDGSRLAALHSPNGARAAADRLIAVADDADHD